MDTRVELTMCSMALYSAQITWNELMKCPWTLACALYLREGDADSPKPTPDRRQECVPAVSKDADKDKSDTLQVLNIDRGRPKKFAPVFAAIDRIPVQDMLESSIKLDSVMRRQKEAHAVITAFGADKFDSLDGFPRTRNR